MCMHVRTGSYAPELLYHLRIIKHLDAEDHATKNKTAVLACLLPDLLLKKCLYQTTR